MALDSLSSTLKIQLNWTAEDNLTGDDYSPVQNTGTITHQSSVGTSAANNAAGGGNELISWIQSISASSSATIDLTSLTNILQASGISLARVKGIVIRLLSTTDDETNGTAATYVTVGNNSSNDWTSQSGGRGWLASATSVLDIPNGGAVGASFPSAAGVLVDSTHKIIKIANADSSVAAKVQISIQGATS